MAVTNFVRSIVLCTIAALLATTAGSLAQADESVNVLKVSPAKNQVAPVITALAIQPGGHLLASGGDDHVVRIWDTETGKVVYSLDGHTDWVRDALFTSDGKTLITAGDDGRVITWDATQKMRRSYLLSLAHPVHAIDITPDDSHVAVVGFKTAIHIVDIATGLTKREIKAPHHDLCAVAISHGGRMFAVACGDGHVHIHRWDDGKRLRELHGHKRRIKTLAFMPHAQRLLSAGEDRTVRVWDINSSTAVQVLRPGRCKIASLAVTSRDKIIVGTSDNTIHVFDGQTGRELDVLNGHTGTVAALTIDNSRLFSAGFDTTIREWSLDAVDGEVAAKQTENATR